LQYLGISIHISSPSSTGSGAVLQQKMRFLLKHNQPKARTASALVMSPFASMLTCLGQQEDKLEPSEQLGDLLRQAGDADAALKCYRASGATTKVIEGMC